jgi:hypothetical protein
MRDSVQEKPQFDVALRLIEELHEVMRDLALSWLLCFHTRVLLLTVVSISCTRRITFLRFNYRTNYRIHYRTHAHRLRSALGVLRARPTRILMTSSHRSWSR